MKRTAMCAARRRIWARAHGKDDGMTLQEAQLGLGVLADVYQKFPSDACLDACAAVLLERGWMTDEGRP